MQLLSLRQCITNLKHATCIRQTYDIAWPCLIDSTLSLCHKLCGRGKAHGLSLTHMQIRLVALELATADLTESDTRAVVRIDIGCNLKDKTSKLLLLGLHLTLFRFRWTRTGGNLHKAVQQLLHAKVIQGRTKEHWGHLS